MSLSDINSLQTTVADLKSIIDRNHSGNPESTLAVKQMELLLSELERKTAHMKARNAESMLPPLSTASMPATL